MPAKRFAAESKVAVAKSRGEIDALLRHWGCDGIRWADHFSEGRTVLEFIWSHDDDQYLARLELQLPGEDELRAGARHASTGNFMPTKYARLRKEAGQTEMRILLLWLKASFNAIDLGIVEAATVFLPFLVGADGQTVAQVALPKMRSLLTRGAQSMFHQIGPGDG